MKLPGRCWPPEVGTKVGLYNGVISVFIDWLLATLPIAFLWDMQLSRKAKVGVCVLMAMGFFTGITSIVRTVVTKKVIAAGKTADYSWISIELRVWGELEILIGLIAACIPTIKPIYSIAASTISSSWSRSKGGGSSGRRAYIEAESEDRHRLHTIRPVADPYSTSMGETLRSGDVKEGTDSSWMYTESADRVVPPHKYGEAIPMTELRPQRPSQHV